MFMPPALSGNFNQAVMVHESINNGCGKPLINKDLPPFLYRPVGGNDNGAFLGVFEHTPKKVKCASA
jgi:hypothetical protein